MEIEVSLPHLLRDSVGGRDRVRVVADTLGEALAVLREAYPRLRVHLYDEAGRTRPHVLIYFNGENVARLDSLDARLRPGDQLEVLQAVSGG